MGWKLKSFLKEHCILGRFQLVWPTLHSYFWGPAQSGGDEKNQNNVVPSIFMKLWSRNNLDQLDWLTPYLVCMYFTRSNYGLVDHVINCQLIQSWLYIFAKKKMTIQAEINYIVSSFRCILFWHFLEHFESQVLDFKFNVKLCRNVLCC